MFGKMFQVMKMAMTGEIIHQIDTSIAGDNCQISFRLKRERKTGREYVVMAGIATGNYQYYPMEIDEFDRLVESALQLRSRINSGVKKTESNP
jgi:hypothetical protein